MTSRRICIAGAIGAMVAGLASSLSATPATAVGESSGGVFVPLTPTNIWSSLGSGGDMAAGSSREVQVTGVGGVPSTGVGAVVVDVGGYSNGSSHIALSPKGGPSWSPIMKLTSNQDQHSNTVIIPPGAGGKVVITSSAGTSTKLNIDVQGYFTTASDSESAGGYTPVLPERVLATNSGTGINGKLNAGSSYAVQVAGRGDIPPDATAVFANVRVFEATQPGGLYVGTASPVPTTWNALAYEDGRYNDSGLSLKLSSSGKINLRPSHGSIHVVIDVQGYFTPGTSDGGSYTPLSNGYYYETYAASEPIEPGETRSIPVLGAGGIPDGDSVGSIATTVQAHNWTPSGGGSLVIYNPDTGRNGTSSIAFSGTYSMPEMSTSLVGVSSEGEIAVHNYSDKRVHLLLAAQGWFSRPEPSEAELTTYGVDSDELEDLRTIAADEGISLQAAVDSYGWQNDYAEALTEVQAQFPEEYAGSTVNESGPPSARIDFVGAPPAGADAIVAEVDGVDVDIDGGAAYSLKTQGQIVEAAHEEVMNTPGVMHASSYYESDSGAVVTTVELEAGSTIDTDLVGADALDRIETQVDPAPLPSVEIEISGAESLNEDTIRGGVSLTDGEDKFQCTSGWPVVGTNENGKGLITADHCANHYRYNKRDVLTWYSRLPSKRGDIDYRKSSEAVGKSFYYEFGKYRRIKGLGTPSVNQKICKFGRKSGKTCDTVRTLRNCRDEYCNLVDMDHRRAGPGDSGGPWFVGGRAYGVHSGWHTAWFKKRDQFTPLYDTLADLSVKLSR